MTKQTAVYIVDGLRTPYLKARGKPGPFSAADLAVAAARPLLARQAHSPTDIDEVITGCVMPSEKEANISRIVSLRLNCGKAVPAWTVQRNCASGMQAIDSAVQSIACGRSDLVLAGGVEAMSHAPLLYNNDMVQWFAKLNSAKSLTTKFKTLFKFRPRFLSPVIALLDGLTDQNVGLSMGQTAENIAYRFDITREHMDEFAVNSHRRAAAAIDKGYFSEVTPAYTHTGEVYTEDDGLRRETSVEKLATLKPFFDKPFGAVTAGNSSQITDGAAYLLIASEQAVKRYQLPTLAKIIDTQWVGVDPSEMGLAPVHAVVQLLKRQQLTRNDVDYWEINEAFAGQVLACLAAWQDPEYAREHFAMTQPLGQVPMDRLNIDGGAIALGHPVGSSGARIVLHLAQVLKRKRAKRGMATICIGGGQAGAMLLESTI